MDQSLLENIKENAAQREKVINELGIFELRGLGRELGVPSPTTRKRDELVDLILDRLNNGTNQVLQKKTRKGRPCKTLNNINQIVGAMTGEENFNMAKLAKRMKSYEEIIVFAQETPVFSLIEEDIKEDFKGVLRVSNNVAYFLDTKTCTKVFVPRDLVIKFELRTGDLLDVEASKMNSSNQYIVSQIKTINFEPSNTYHAINLADKQPIISFDLMPYGDFQLYRGRRNIVEYKQNIYEDNRFVKFAEDLIKKDYSVIILGLNTSFEDSIMFNNIQGAINLSTCYGEKCQEGLEKVVDAISLATRLGEMGKKIVLFVNDIIEVLNTLDLCFVNTERIMGHCTEAVVIVQKLISLARAYKDGSELTLVMTYRDFNSDDQFLINEVFRVGNKFVQ